MGILSAHLWSCLRPSGPERCFARCTARFTGGEFLCQASHLFMGRCPANRFRGLGATEVLGVEVPVADSVPARFLGLAWLERGRAAPGLLLPRCRSVHTFGMRFALDLYFLDGEFRVLEARRSVGPRRVVTVRGARSVLELPAGGESPPSGP